MATKSFKEWLNESQVEWDYDDVDVWDEFNHHKEKEEMIDHVVQQVEEGTNKKVVKVSGRAGESDFDLKLELENGDLVEAFYKYAPYFNKERKQGYEIITYTKGDKTYEKTALDVDQKKIDAGQDVSYIIKEIYKEYNLGDEPNEWWEMQLPRENFETEGYEYYIDNESKGYTMINVAFASPEVARAWVKALQDQLSKLKKIKE
jgi:hypothetical protein